METKVINIRDRYGSVQILEELISHIKKGRMTGFVVGIRGEVDDEMREKYPENIHPNQGNFTQFYFCGSDSCFDLLGLANHLGRKISDYIEEGG